MQTEISVKLKRSASMKRIPTNMLLITRRRTDWLLITTAMLVLAASEAVALFTKLTNVFITTRTCKVSRPRDSGLDLSNRYEI